MIIAEGMIIDHQRSMIMTWGYEHWSLWSLIMLIHTWMCCSYYDRLLIMGDDMLIIAMNRLVIMHDQWHIHVIMNIIVNPIWMYSYIQIFSDTNIRSYHIRIICLIRIYSDIRSYHFFDTNIFGYSFVSFFNSNIFKRKIKGVRQQVQKINGSNCSHAD